MACLRLVTHMECNPHAEQSSDVMSSYACRYWLTHLQYCATYQVYWNDLKKQQPVGAMVMKILRDPSTTLRAFSERGMYEDVTPNTSRVLVACLQPEIITASTDDGTRDWLRSVIEHPDKIYEPILLMFLELWLRTEETFDDGLPAIPLYAVTQGQLQVNPHTPSLQNILEAAYSPGFPEDARWHLGLANALQEFEYHVEVIHHLEIALQKDPSMDFIYFRLGETWGKLGNKPKAIECFTRSEAALVPKLHMGDTPDASSHDVYNGLSLTCRFLTSTYHSLGYMEKAKEHSMKAVGHQPTNTAK